MSIPEGSYKIFISGPGFCVAAEEVRDDGDSKTSDAELYGQCLSDVLRMASLNIARESVVLAVAALGVIEDRPKSGAAIDYVAEGEFYDAAQKLVDVWKQHDSAVRSD